jgi:hypothetical protein
MRKWLFLFASMLIAACVVSAGVFSARRQQPKKQWPKEPRVTSMPQIYSKVKNLEVIRAWIVGQDTDSPAASVEIRNNSDKDVVAVDLVCGEGGITRNGLHDEEHPVVVIKAHGTTIMEMGFGAMTFGAPLVVSAVTYADGTEEGDESSLKLMHKMRELDRERLKQQRNQPSPQGGTNR